MSDERVTKKLFNKKNEYELSWSNGIGQLFEELGLNQIFVNKGKCNLTLCNERLREQQKNGLLN